VSTASAKELEAAVKRHRKAKGLSQLELAEAIGVPYSTICRLERGDARPQRLKRIAGGLGGALFELASLAEPGVGASAGGRGGKLDDLSDESLRKVERYVERIEKQEGGHDSERAR
jgi:transcriptional regulator with XRE-family HTH domain